MTIYVVYRIGHGSHPGTLVTTLSRAFKTYKAAEEYCKKRQEIERSADYGIEEVELES